MAKVSAHIVSLQRTTKLILEPTESVCAPRLPFEHEETVLVESLKEISCTFGRGDSSSRLPDTSLPYLKTSERSTYTRCHKTGLEDVISRPCQFPATSRWTSAYSTEPCLQTYHNVTQPRHAYCLYPVRIVRKVEFVRTS